jgi:uncharacterized coiled-coil protein SlyX
MTEIRNSKQCIVLKGFGHWILEFVISKIREQLRLFFRRVKAINSKFDTICFQ